MDAMAMQPNWFDKEFNSKVEKESVENILLDIAKNPRIIQAVKDSLSQRDSNAKRPGWAGPSRTQAIRNALVEVLSAGN